MPAADIPLTGVDTRGARWARVWISLRRPCVLAIASGVAITAALWIVVVAGLGRRFDAEVQFQLRNDEQLARLLGEHALRTFRGMDQVLRYLVAKAESDGFALDMREQKRLLGLDGEVLVQMSVADEHGMARSSQLGSGTVDISDREHFRVHQRAPDAGLFISEPLIGRTSGALTIQLTRRVDKADGSFGGVAVVSVRSSYFNDLFAHVIAESGEAIALVGLDHVPRAQQLRSPEAAAVVAEPALWRQLSGGRRQGSLFVRAAAGRRPGHLIAYQQVGDLPLAILVATSEADVRQAAEADGRRELIAAGAASVIVLLASLLLALSLRAQRGAMLARARAEAELKESRDRLALALSGSAVAAWDHNVAEQVVELSAEWSAMLGGPPLETRMTTAELLSRVHPDDLPPVLEASRNILKGTQPEYRVQHRVRRFDGDWIWVESAGRVFEGDGRGRIIRMVGTNANITEMKRIQHQLEQAKKELEARVAQRTEQLAHMNEVLQARILREVAIHRELRAAKEEADVANAAKSDFLAKMSHEIRTPMHGILALSELVLAGNIGAEEKEHLQLALDSSRMLLQLIDDLLDISKIEAGRLELESVSFAPGDALREVASLLAPRAEAKGIALSCRVKEGFPPQLVGDPFRFRQALYNLLGNALKFTERGSVDAVLEIVDRSHSKAIVQLTVRDTGIGIPQDKLDTIFEKFAQVDSSMSRRFGGSGLGLAITRSLAELMGGRLWAQSVEGQGSTFTLQIRLDVPGSASPAHIPGRAAGSSQPGADCSEPGDGSAERAAGSAERAALSSPGTAGPAPSAERAALKEGAVVLVAEDNLVNQHVARKLLRVIGCRPLFASNGQEAADLCIRQRPDAVLMDVQMPVMDGLAAAAQIRRLEIEQNLPRVPIIALTANAMQGDRERCLAAGMDDYLTKPFNAAGLRTVLARWLVPQPARAAAL